MKVHLYHPIHFECWDYRAVDTGIGGSETHQIEMAWRLAQRGHEVISYAPLPDDCERQWRGTEWRKLEEATFEEPGLWVIYRSPGTMDQIEPRPDQSFWLLCQDENYAMTEEQAEKFDRIVVLCATQGRNIVRGKPFLEGKIWQSSNGIRCDLIREVEAEGIPERNPFRLMYASSPDRGLENLLWIFRRAREYVPELELHAFYGFKNMEKLEEKYPRFAKIRQQIKKDANQPGVFLHGRVPQKELYREWLKTSLWVYSTNFTETSCITCMEAQALGAIPVTNPLWALSENVGHGIFIEGDATDRLTRCRYAGEIVRIFLDENLRSQLSNGMMEWARLRYNWERIIDQWEAEWFGFQNRMNICQFNYQLKESEGKILNLGCGCDPADFKSLGATSVDSCAIDSITGVENKLDLLCDIRHLPAQLKIKFDTVLMGDVLEHYERAERPIFLKEAKSCLRNGGKIVITLPNDDRPMLPKAPNYGQHKPVSVDEFVDWKNEIGMEIKKVQSIDYGHFMGWGLTLEATR